MSNDYALQVQLVSSALNEITFQGETDLHIAAREGKQEQIGEILEQNRSLAQVRNKFGETALIIACKYGHEQIVNQLLGEYRKPDRTHQSSNKTTSKGGETSLLYAAVQGRCLNIVRAILDHPSAWHDDLMTKEDKSGRCAIHIAAIRGNLDIISEFMSKKPTCIDIRSSDHKSVLHFAVQYNRTGIVKKVLEGREPGTKKRLVSQDHELSQNTALHLAAQYDVDPQLLDLLLSGSVDVNAVNAEGLTPLDIACAAAQQNPNCVIIVQKLEDAKGKRCANQKQNREWRDSDIVKTHMLVASLIATVTFAAMFQIPGGIEDDKQSLNYGAAKLAFHKHFRLFIFSDTVAFAASLSVVFLWLLQGQIQHFLGCSFSDILSITSEANLLVSIICTMVAFVSATVTVLIPHKFESLSNREEELFAKYKWLRNYEIAVAFGTPYAVAALLCTVIMQKKLYSLVKRHTNIPYESSLFPYVINRLSIFVLTQFLIITGFVLAGTFLRR